MATTKAYKLFRKTKEGDLTSLFINKSRRLPIGEWMDHECLPTKGFAVRPGWHCTAKPEAPHLKERLASGEVRVWAEVEMEDFTEEIRPKSQGGKWFLAKRIKILGTL